MALHVERIGAQHQPGGAPGRRLGPTLVLAHGFTQNAGCWGRFGTALAEYGPVLAVDGPGHGRSGHDEADLVESARLLTEAGGTAVYVGYSMGGRVALHAALARPDLVEGLVLIGATAGIDEPAARAERRATDNALADRLLAEDLSTFLDRWLSGPLFSGLSEEQGAKPQRLTNRPEGLAASLRNCGTGTQEPLWARLGSLEMPVLVMAGDRDRKFTDLGRRLVAAMTGTSAELRVIPGTHAVHLEQPERAAATITEWLDEQPIGEPQST